MEDEEQNCTNKPRNQENLRERQRNQIIATKNMNKGKATKVQLNK